MTPKPLVSVVVPAYQAERFLAETLESALAQDYSPFEVVVVDNGCTDRTAEIAARYPVRIVDRPHAGIAASRNTGVKAAQGEMLAILDADDLWPSDRLSLQVEHLLGHPELDIVMGMTQIFLTPGVRRPEVEAWIARGPMAAHPSTMLVRRKLFETVGGFDESIELSNDIDWLVRAKDQGARSATLPQVVLHYRMHEANNTRGQVRFIEREWLRLLRASVRRQRGEGNGG